VRRQRAEAGPEINAEGDAVTDTKRRPARQQRWADYDGAMLQNYVVYEPEQVHDTGLLDAEGNKIVKVRQPIGFDLTGRRKP
jgi:hypothetical protein